MRKVYEYQVAMRGEYIDYAITPDGQTVYPTKHNAWGDWVQDKFCTLASLRSGLKRGSIKMLPKSGGR